MFRRLMALLLISLLLVPAIIAQDTNSWNDSHSLAWEYDFETGYISTTPLFADEQIIVRTSGNSEPAVTAFDTNGKKTWQHLNPSSTSNDMSPLFHVQAGQGECGAWPEMVLVGWTNGLIEALKPSDGEVFWSIQTEVIGWGVTGQFALDGEFVVVPTRQGIGQYCLADGQQQWWTQTGLGWRNGVAVDNTGYFVGDEAGQLWHINRTGAATSHALQLGKIRHPPLLTNAGIILHTQQDSRGTIAVVHSSDGRVLQQFSTGLSPAIPSLRGDYVVTGDSSAIRLLLCTNECEIIDEVPFHTNGEIGWMDNGTILAPSNTPNSAWGLFTFDAYENLTFESLEVGIQGYGTAAPLQYLVGGTTFTAFGNDQSLLRVYSDLDLSESLSNNEFDWGVQGLIFAMFLLIGSSTVSLLNGKFDWFLRTSSLLFLIILLLIIPDLSMQWSQAFDEKFPATAPSEEWNEQWPDTWLGTQIVIFEFDGEEHTAGGFVGHDTVFSLTLTACDELGFELSSESTEIGVYVNSIAGVESNGWEFTVDDSKGIVSADQSIVESTSIIRWYLA
ncbi:MAG: PQQ-binding-like beta-propeller repeat protein [Euryarchaeota archaeon]|nr:PQQ-binding-like beta-propeller repeat protein [Euryarchaeota archaeon]